MAVLKICFFQDHKMDCNSDNLRKRQRVHIVDFDDDDGISQEESEEETQLSEIHSVNVEELVNSMWDKFKSESVLGELSSSDDEV